MTAVVLCSLSLAGAEERLRSPVDRVMLAMREQIGCTAATVAISKRGQLLLARGYGWYDRDRTRPVSPHAMMRIASVSKPITAAVVKRLLTEKNLSLETKIVSLLKIPDDWGAPADPRWGEITVQHLLEHEGGWDRGATFDPMFLGDRVRRVFELERGPTARDIARFMWTQPLQFDPGAKSVYSNFGYSLLGRIIEDITGESYFAMVEQFIAEPLGIDELKLGRDVIGQRDRREVSYPQESELFTIEVLDAHGGLIASAPALCTFLERYGLRGDVRTKEDRIRGVFFGSLPGTTAMVIQRPDGIDVAVLLNGRRTNAWREDNRELLERMREAIDEQFGE